MSSDFETEENRVFRAVLTIAVNGDHTTAEAFGNMLRNHPDTINVEILNPYVLNWLVARDSNLELGAAEQQVMDSINVELGIFLYADWLAGVNWQDVSPAEWPDKKEREHAWVDRQNRQA